MTDYLTSETPPRIINDGQGFVLNGTAAWVDITPKRLGGTERYRRFEERG